jgi:hypothetical protein
MQVGQQSREERSREKRATLRFDVLFPVLIEVPEMGTIRCVARNVSKGGLFVETIEPLPLGVGVRVHFMMDRNQGEIVAQAEIKNHYYLCYGEDGDLKSVIGMGLRFLAFEQDGGDVLNQSLARFRTIH